MALRIFIVFLVGVIGAVPLVSAQKYMTNATTRFSSNPSVSANYNVNSSLQRGAGYSNSSSYKVSSSIAGRYSNSPIYYVASEPVVEERSGGGGRYDASNWLLSRTYSNLSNGNGSYTSAPKEESSSAPATVGQSSGGGRGRYDASKWFLSRKYDELVSEGRALAVSTPSKLSRSKSVKSVSDNTRDVESLASSLIKAEKILPTLTSKSYDHSDRENIPATRTQSSIIPSFEPYSGLAVGMPVKLYSPGQERDSDEINRFVEELYLRDKKTYVTEPQDSPEIRSFFVADLLESEGMERSFETETAATSFDIDFYQRFRPWILFMCMLFGINILILLLNFSMMKKAYFMVKKAYKMQENKFKWVHSARKITSPDVGFNWVNKVKRIAHVFFMFFSLGQLFYSGVVLAADDKTVPDYLMYEGSLMNSSGTPLTGVFEFRFSFWTNVDYMDTDVVDGFINEASSDYLGWNEIQPKALGEGGRFSIEIGASKPLVYDIFENPRVYLQVEVKKAGRPYKEFEILDVDFSSDIIDRMVFDSVPYAFNADKLDFRDTGFEAGDIPYLNEEGKLPGSAIPSITNGDGAISESMIPGGTNQASFMLDADGSDSVDPDSFLSLIFGNSISHVFSWAGLLNRFTLSDSLEINGDLLVTGAIIGNDNTEIGGDLDVEGDLNVEGVTRGGEDDLIELDDNVNVEGDLKVSGNIDGGADDFIIFNDNVGISGDLVFTGGIEGGDDDLIELNDNVGIVGDLAVSGTITGYVDVENIDVEDLDVSGDVDIEGNLNVEGDTSGGADDLIELDDNVDVEGDLSVSGTIVGNDNVEIGGDLVVIGDIEGGIDDEIVLDDDVIITGDFYVVGELNGIEFGNRFQYEMLSPLYPGTVFDGDGTDNMGNMFDELDDFGGVVKNVIRWETWKNDQQDYDVSVLFIIPNDFVAFQDVPISFDYRTEGTLAQSKIDFMIEKGGELGVDQLGGAGEGLSSVPWETKEFTFVQGVDWDGDDTMLFRIRMYSVQDFYSRIGDIRINYIRE